MYARVNEQQKPKYNIIIIWWNDEGDMNRELFQNEVDILKFIHELKIDNDLIQEIEIYKISNEIKLEPVTKVIEWKIKR